ncbi:hypothetical protein WDU94_010732 [Cyamophila willieti]
MEFHHLLNDQQFGFRPSRSTSDAVSCFLKELDAQLSKGNRTIGLFCDLTKAFDCVNHDILLAKLPFYGIRGPKFENYFMNRVQIVKIGKVMSTKRNIEFGLVQGGINSPQWYNLQGTYDIKYLPMNGEIKMFADDTAIINIHKNLEVSIKNTQEDLIILQKYFYNNSIFMNNLKTETMVIGNVHSRLNTYLKMKNKIKCHSRTCLEIETYKTKCNCPVIDYKQDFRYLGVYIDYDFKFKTHVEIITKKLRMILYRLNKCYANNVPMFIKRTIYYSLIESILRYGVTLYSHCPAYVLNSLYSLQKKLMWKIFTEEPPYLLSLSKQILLENHFRNEKFRRRVPNPYKREICIS